MTEGFGAMPGIGSTEGFPPPAATPEAPTTRNTGPLPGLAAPPVTGGVPPLSTAPHLTLTQGTDQSYQFGTTLGKLPMPGAAVAPQMDDPIAQALVMMGIPSTDIVFDAQGKVQGYLERTEGADPVLSRIPGGDDAGWVPEEVAAPSFQDFLAPSMAGITRTANPLDTSPGFSPDRLSAPARAAYDGLSAQGQEQFSRVYAASGPQGRAQLIGLLRAGMLQSRDAQGNSLLFNLDRLVATPLHLPPNAPANYRQQVFDNMIGDLSDPISIKQGAQETCGATVTQRDMAFNRPSDYVALATGLLSESGIAKLPDGRTVRREPGSLTRLGDDRPPVSRVVQSAFMEMGPLDYDARSDRQGISVFGKRIDIAPGMSGRNMKAAIAGARGVPQALMTRSSYLTALDGGGPELGTSGYNLIGGVTHDLNRQRSEGRRLPMVPVLLKWGPGTVPPDLHIVSVVAVTAERAYYANPHGSNYEAVMRLNPTTPTVVEPETGRRYFEARNSESGRLTRYYEDGLESIRFADLQKNIVEAVVSQEAYDQYQVPGAKEPPGSVGRR